MSSPNLKPFEDILSKRTTRADLEHFLELLMEENFAERGCLWLEKDNEMSFVYHGDEELRDRFPFSRQVVDSVLEHGRGFVSFDSRTDERLGPSQSIAVNNVRSCLCAAAKGSNGEIQAIAYFDNCASVGNFTETDLEFLNQVMEIFEKSLAR